MTLTHRGLTSHKPVIPTYIGHNGGNSVSTTSLIITQPAGILAGDIGILAYRSGGGETVPAGWTSYNGIYYKVYGASEGSVVLTLSPSNAIAACLAVYRGASTEVPFDGFSTKSVSSGTSGSTNTVTSTSANTRLIGMMSTNASTGTPVVSASGGATLRDGRNAGTRACGIADRAGPTSVGGVSATVTFGFGVAVFSGTLNAYLLRAA